MSAEQTHISVKGKQVAVPSLRVGGFEIVVTGRLLKVASVKSEHYAEGDPADNPDRLLAGLREQGVKADLFTFSQRVPDVVPRYRYPMHWDNVAALQITSYKDWFEKRLSQDTRRNVRLAAKRGVVVRSVQFDDDFVEGIRGIYDESPIRQGRPFWHYGKDHETVKLDNASFVSRSEFIGAFVGNELIGFLKMVYLDKSANIMQILSKAAHYDKRPMNALINKAVEICDSKSIPCLVYCKYSYHGSYLNDLAEFKRRNGFEKVSVPQYFIPLTLWGQIAVSMNLQLGATQMLPDKLVSMLLKWRTMYYQRRTRAHAADSRGPDAVSSSECRQ